MLGLHLRRNRAVAIILGWRLGIGLHSCILQTQGAECSHVASGGGEAIGGLLVVYLSPLLIPANKVICC